MWGDEVVARKRSPPITLAARDEDGLALFVGEPIERLLDGEIGAPLTRASGLIRKHVGPPFFAGWFLRVRPRAVGYRFARLQHGGDHARDLGLRAIEQDKVRIHRGSTPRRSAHRPLAVWHFRWRELYLTQQWRRLLPSYAVPIIGKTAHLFKVSWNVHLSKNVHLQMTPAFRFDFRLHNITAFRRSVRQSMTRAN